VLLIYAAEYGNLELVKYLITEHSADPRTRGDWVASNPAKSGNLELVKYLITKHRADPQAHNDWPLIVAVGISDLEMIKCLISKGADPNRLSHEQRKILGV